MGEYELSPVEDEKDTVYGRALAKVLAREGEIAASKELSEPEKAIERALLLFDPDVRGLVEQLSARFHLDNNRNPLGELPPDTSFIFYSDTHHITAEPADMPTYKGGKAHTPLGTIDIRAPWMAADPLSRHRWTKDKPERVTNDSFATLDILAVELEAKKGKVFAIDGGDRGSDGELLSDMLNTTYTTYLGQPENMPILRTDGNHEGCPKYEKWTWLANDMVFGRSFGYQEVGDNVVAFFDTNLHDEKWCAEWRDEIEAMHAYAQKVAAGGDEEKAALVTELATMTGEGIARRKAEQEAIIAEVAAMGTAGKEVVIAGHNADILGKINEQLPGVTDAFFGHQHFSVSEQSPAIVRNHFQRVIGKNADGQSVTPHMAAGGVLGMFGLDYYGSPSTAVEFNLKTRKERVIDLTAQGKKIEGLL